MTDLRQALERLSQQGMVPQPATRTPVALPGVVVHPSVAKGRPAASRDERCRRSRERHRRAPDRPFHRDREQVDILHRRGPTKTIRFRSRAWKPGTCSTPRALVAGGGSHPVMTIRKQSETISGKSARGRFRSETLACDILVGQPSVLMERSPCSRVEVPRGQATVREAATGLRPAVEVPRGQATVCKAATGRRPSVEVLRGQATVREAATGLRPAVEVRGQATVREAATGLRPAVEVPRGQTVRETATGGVSLPRGPPGDPDGRGAGGRGVRRLRRIAPRGRS